MLNLPINHNIYPLNQRFFDSFEQNIQLVQAYQTPSGTEKLVIIFGCQRISFSINHFATQTSIRYSIIDGLKENDNYQTANEIALRMKIVLENDPSLRLSILFGSHIIKLTNGDSFENIEELDEYFMNILVASPHLQTLKI
jgi:hypothetical protein